MSERLADGAWLDRSVSDGVGLWLANATGEISSVALGTIRLPLIFAEDDSTTSYVSSVVSGWVRYPLAEAEKCLNGPFRTGARLISLPLKALLERTGLARPAMLGNWLISTNLHPEASERSWRDCFDMAIALAGRRPVVMRSVCPEINRMLAEQLVAAGWVLIPARLVYLCNPAAPEVWKHNHVRKDRRLLAAGDLAFGGPESVNPQDLKRLKVLFRALFIEKHSLLNPDYTDAFFEFCMDTRFLEFHVLREAGQAVGVIGLLHRYGWLTTPLIGYDTTMPLERGLYRRLMALLLAESDRRGTRLHYSSGAGSFKLGRGAQASVEYTAVFARHLPSWQRLAIRSFARAMNRFAVPVLERYG